MNDDERGQVSRSAAEVYDEFFVPALFHDWTSRVADAARIEPGQRVLDVACGTGVLTREVADRVGPSGAAVGLDVNDGMLAVARRKAPELDWRKGRAEELPFDDGSFAAVVSQFGLMFFEDRVAALREMRRVAKPGGRMAIAVWGPQAESPGYAAMTELLRGLFGEPAANALRAPFALGDIPSLRALFAESGLPEIDVRTLPGTARFPSLRSWIYTDVKGWTLADAIDDEGLERLMREAEHALAGFVSADGGVRFPIPAHVVTAISP
jgi:SAM-dependent methyltransferase